MHRRVCHSSAVFGQRQHRVLRLDELNLRGHLGSNLELVRGSLRGLPLLELGGGGRLDRAPFLARLGASQRGAGADVHDALAPGHVENAPDDRIPFIRVTGFVAVVRSRGRELMKRDEADGVGVHVRHIDQDSVFSHAVHDTLDLHTERELVHRGDTEETLGLIPALRHALVREAIRHVHVVKDGLDERRLRGYPRGRRDASGRERQGQPRGRDGGVHGHNPRQHRLSQREHLLRVHAARLRDVGELRGRREAGEPPQEPYEYTRVGGGRGDVPWIDSSDDDASDVLG